MKRKTRQQDKIEDELELMVITSQVDVFWKIVQRQIKYFSLNYFCSEKSRHCEFWILSIYWVWLEISMLQKM